MSRLENSSYVRPVAFAALGAFAVVLFKELTTWVFGRGGSNGMSLLAEVADSQMLFTKVAVLFLGLSVAHVAFGKSGETGRWKMLLSAVALAMIVPILGGKAFGSID